MWLRPHKKAEGSLAVLPPGAGMREDKGEGRQEIGNSEAQNAVREDGVPRRLFIKGECGAGDKGEVVGGLRPHRRRPEVAPCAELSPWAIGTAMRYFFFWGG